MIIDRLDPQKLEAVLSLIAAASDRDGVPPVAEHVLLHLRHGGDKDDRHFIAEESGTVVGYAHLDLTDQVEGPSAELVVHPEYRNRGIGRSLIEELRRVAGDSLRLWSHGDLESARTIANSAGFSRTRTVIQMRRSLTDPIPEFDKKIEIRHFLPGIDEAEWIALNNRSFIDHPEQSNWNQRDLAIRQKESWFDERGFSCWGNRFLADS